MTLLTYKDGPYSFKVKRTYAWFLPKFNVLFEDTVIRTFHGGFEEVRDIVFLLNTAWAEGYNSGNMWGEK